MGLLQTRYWPQHGYGPRLGNQVQTNLLDALMFQVQHSSGLVRQIDDPALYDGSTIIDAHNHCSAVSQVGDLYIGPQRQRRMCRGQVVHIESFATGGFFAVEIASIPGRRPNLVRTRPLLNKRRLGGWFRLIRSRTTSVVGRARVALSRSQAGDAQKHRQSMSNACSHSVHLAYKRFGRYVGRSQFWPKVR
jgi:hypothetical protein